MTRLEWTEPAVADLKNIQDYIARDSAEYADALIERLMALLQASRAEPDPVWIPTELRRKEVTLELLHLEYLADHPDGFRYSAFCRRYRDWTGRQRLSMRQVYTAGEKTFVDYAGLQPHLVAPDTGELFPVELFVAVLGHPYGPNTERGIYRSYKINGVPSFPILAVPALVVLLIFGVPLR